MSEEHAPSQDSDSWQFSSEPDGSYDQTGLPKSGDGLQPVVWQAHEFIDHEKSSNWYVGLAVAGIILAIVTYLVSSKDAVPVMVVLVTVAAFGLMASRKPRELQYSIDASGIRIGERLYPFAAFKSFSQVEEDGNIAVWLLPLERFRPIISLYYKLDDEAAIIDALSAYLPYESREPGFVDHLMQRIKF